MPETTRAGFVALIGLPNAGKSSLLNHLVGTKLSIVTPFAQTTRERVVGIDSDHATQMVFLDTPGIVDPAYLLHHAMTTVVEQAMEDADVVVLLVDATRPPPELAPEVVERLRRFGGSLAVALNKVDAAAETDVERLREWSREEFGSEPLVISATTGRGVEELRGQIRRLLPESPFLYPEDELSTQTTRFFVSELIRETAFEQYSEEVPYSIAVRIDEFRESETPLFIRATVYVERPSQKAIVIGKGGAAIRQLGTAARAKVEEFLDTHVYLDLWIKVLPKWRKDPLELQRLGFPVPPEKQSHA